MDSTSYRIIFTACGSKNEAEKIARLLVEERAAACVQMVGASSIYCWKGKTTKDEEVLLIIKTRASLYPKIKDLIVSVHSYEIPEIVEVAVSRGYEKYFAWIDEVAPE